MHGTMRSSGNQRWRLRLPISLAVLLGAALCLVASSGQSNEAPAKPLQTTMQQFFRALTSVFPASLDLRQFQDPAQRPRLREALSTLAQHAEHLAEHGEGVPPYLDFLRHALARDTRAVWQRYEHEEYQAAQYTLHRLTENCFACHSKLPPTRRFVLGQRFLAATDLSRLPLKERARLAVATRQFDTALSLYEALLASADLSAADIGLTGVFEDYLKIALRVDHDAIRVLLALDAFRQRPDVPYYLSEYLANWLEAIKALRDVDTPADHLSYARLLIRQGQEQNHFPADRRGLVHFVVASSLLHQYVDAAPAAGEGLAEAYYLLGVAESFISRSLWVSETDFFLETAIRLAPQSVHARKAYAFLEEYTIAGYTGSSGVHLPPEVRTHLEELRRLMGTAGERKRGL